MTLIYPSSSDEVVLDKPRLHALIIGVSHYRHLPGGGGQLAELTFELRQVTSPKPSALAITRWLVEQCRNNDVPVGSVELLAGPNTTWTNSNGSMLSVEEPTLDGIKRATTEWFNRCHKRPDNIAFFYFCGHGMSRFLLPQDFGDPTGLLWDKSIDFDAFKNSFWRRCQADTQLFFVDACRDQPAALSKNPPRGDPLVSGDDTAPLPQNTLVFYAAAPEQKVKVPEQNNLTCFSQAILQCLNGGAAKKPPIGDYWEVNLHTLAGNLVELTGRLGERYNTPQSAASEGCWGKPIILHQMDAPMVPGRIDCRTQKARDQSSIRLVRHLREPMNSARGEPRPWYADFELGWWKIDVDFDEIAPVSKEVFVDTPFFDHLVKE